VTSASANAGEVPKERVLQTSSVEVHAGGPTFRVELRGEESTVRAIDVRDAVSGAIVQTFEPRDAFGDGCETDLHPIDETWGLSTVDMNFDGFRDIRLQCGKPDPILVVHRNWLFDRKTGRFAPSPELDAIQSADYDPVHRTIIAIGEITCSGPKEVVYHWVDDHPVLLHGDESAPCER